jgi:glycerol dehydrogenase
VIPGVDAPAVRILGAPRLYLQGPGVLAQTAEIAGRLGRRPALVTDPEVAALLGAQLIALLGSLDPRVEPLVLAGEITREAVEALAAQARGADVVIAAGGGRALDAGKAVAIRLRTPLVAIPTIASSDAATSRGAVIHEPGGEALVEQLPWNPDAVIVDTAVIAAAPARFLRCGIADALATKFELQACAAVGASTPAGGAPTIAAAALADACYTTVRKHASAALDAVAAATPDAALEAVVEAALLLSGLGFEGGGLSIAHCVAIALAATPGMDGAAHGEQVAYGLLVQLALERDDHALREMAAFYAQIGLPQTLAASGAPKAGGTDIESLAQAAMAAPWSANHPSKPDADALAAAIAAVEALAGAAAAGERELLA